MNEPRTLTYHEMKTLFDHSDRSREDKNYNSKNSKVECYIINQKYYEFGGIGLNYKGELISVFMKKYGTKKSIEFDIEKLRKTFQNGQFMDILDLAKVEYKVWKKTKHKSKKKKRKNINQIKTKQNKTKYFHKLNYKL